jgi:ubiquitin thioesterase OTU1
MFTLSKKPAGGEPGAPTQMKSLISEAIKYEIAADNSCLFNAVSYLCTGNPNREHELRQHVISEIRSKPDIYTELTLGCPPAEYCKWILDPAHWGGYIELEIFSRLYNVEICVLDIEKSSMVPVNACSATKRIFVLYDNTHYDAVVFRGFGVQEAKIVNCDDDMALKLGLELVEILHKAGAYMNENTGMLKCDRCGKLVRGKKEANDHANATGHVDFSQAPM